MRVKNTYSSQSEVAEDTSTLSAHDAPVLDLGEPRVAVHLRELQLCLGADSLWKRRVSDNVSQCLSLSALVAGCVADAAWCIPFWLVLHVRLPLGVVADVANVHITPNVELLRCAELRHDGVAVVAIGRLQIVDEPVMRFNGTHRRSKAAGRTH
jgi:hypothetical protein